MLTAGNSCSDIQVIYIAPLKALVRERMNDWGAGLCKKLGKKVVELTGTNFPAT
jgi:activating signal cointegrator complex subunit 3